jgi:hypothetical protein
VKEKVSMSDLYAGLGRQAEGREAFDDDFGTPGVGGPVFRESPREARAEPRSGIRLVVDMDRRRMRSGESVVDAFDIADIVRQYAPTRGDPKLGNIDREIDFNWKRYETYGKRDYAEQRAYHDQGWREVLHSHFPGRFAPVGTQGPVVIKDMILMERPMRLTVQARNEEILAANRAMRVNQASMVNTPEGQAPRQVFTDRTTREPIPIPNE